MPWGSCLGSRGPEFWAPSHIYGTAEAKDLKFCANIMGWGPNENYAKVGHRWSAAGSLDLVLNFGTFFIYRSSRLGFCHDGILTP